MAKPRRRRAVLRALPGGVAVAALVGSVLPAAGPVTLSAEVGSGKPGVRSAAPGPLPEAPALQPTTPTVAEHRIGQIRARGSTAGGLGADHAGTVRLRTTPQTVTGYAVVGVTWDEPEMTDADLEVRSRTGEEPWSAWQELRADGVDHGHEHDGEHDEGASLLSDPPDRHGPDPDTVEALDTRAGTDPLVVGDVDEVQLRLTATEEDLPRGVRLVVVDPGESVPVEESEEELVLTSAPAAMSDGTTVTRPSRPRIRNRAAWGANEKLRDGSPSYGTIRGGFVHHTVNGNDYDRDDVPAIIRGIYAYHTKGRGWSDIGYNFLVDRFGRLWEGRFGGMNRPVIGAHTLGYNHVAFAVSAIGNFDTVAPPRGMQRSIARLMAWKLRKHKVRPRSTVTMEGRRLRAISGHRDAGQTACPGRYLYAELPRVRRIAGRVGTSEPAPEPEPSTKPFTKRSRLDIPDRVERGSNLIAGVGDVTGDRRPDLLTRSRTTGVVSLRPSGDGGVVRRPIARLRGKVVRRADLMAGVGDVVGRRGKDLVVRDGRTKKLWIFPGHVGGGWSPKILLKDKARWLTSVHSAPDLTGDGRRDLVVRTKDKLVLFPVRPGPKIGKERVLARGWAGRNLTIAGRDLTGNGKPDYLSRTIATGRMVIHRMKGDGRPGRRVTSFTGWEDLRKLVVLGVTPSGRVRLVARAGNGQLVEFFSRR